MVSLVSRITGSLVIGVCWFVFIVLYLAFFSGGFDFWQKVAIFVTSGAIAGAVIAIIWIRWAIR